MTTKPWKTRYDGAAPPKPVAPPKPKRVFVEVDPNSFLECYILSYSINQERQSITDMDPIESRGLIAKSQRMTLTIEACIAEGVKDRRSYDELPSDVREKTLRPSVRGSAVGFARRPKAQSAAAPATSAPPAPSTPPATKEEQNATARRFQALDLDEE